jgi:RHS repeat-associated protein
MRESVGSRRKARGVARVVRLVAMACVLTLVSQVAPGVAWAADANGDGGSEPSLVDRLRDLVGLGGDEAQAPPRDPGQRPVVSRMPEVEVPRRERLPASAVAGPVSRVEELVGERTGNGRFHRLSDGRVEAEIAAAPVNFRDAAGRWHPIDTTVQPAVVAPGPGGFAWSNVTNTYASYFGDRSDRLVRFEHGGRHLEVGLAGEGRPAAPVVNGRSVSYRDAIEGAELVYEVGSTSLKEKIVLSSAPAGEASYTFTIRAAGVEARALPDGSIGFFGPDGDGGPVFVMPKPFMYDDRDDASSPYGKTTSDAVTQTVRQQGANVEVTVSADRGWLTSPDRRYPVVIDPTVKIQPTVTASQDVMIGSDLPATNFDGNWRMSVGTTADGSKYRTLVKFPLDGVPQGVQLDSATVGLYYDQNFGGAPKNFEIEARRVTQAWDETTATWNSMNTFFGPVVGSQVLVDNGDVGRTAANGEWPFSTNQFLTPLAVGKDYQANKNAATGETYEWVPTVATAGTYQVQAHFVPALDRTTVPYTVHHAGGTTQVNVNQAVGTDGVWADLGTFSFNAGTAGKVVLGDVADPTKAAVADAIRLVQPGKVPVVATASSVWHHYRVDDAAQDWVDGKPNHGLMFKAVNEATVNLGGPRYEAAEFAYGGETRNTPKLVLTWGRPGVTLNPPTTITSTGAVLDWTAYADLSSAPGDNIVEYQVHRSVDQSFTPSVNTLVAPVPAGVTSFTDTTAEPTPADSPDPFGSAYYYMVAVKTADGEVIASPTQIARLPKAGRVTKRFQGSGVDTTLSSTQPNTNLDLLSGEPWLSTGDNSGTFGTTRALVRFPDVTSQIPTNARVVDANVHLWTTGTTGSGETLDVHALTRGFNETTATWNQAATGVPWTTPGGDFNPTISGSSTGITNDPEWQDMRTTEVVQGWVNNPSTNHGLLAKVRQEAVPDQRVISLSSEAAEPALAPRMEVTYLEKTSENTYYAPYTPARMIPGDEYTVAVTLTNTTTSAWPAASRRLSYRWTLPDGTDVTTGGNQLETTLPADLAPGESVTVQAHLRTPIQSGEGNKRESFVINWDLRNTANSTWLSATDNIPPLSQQVTVEDPTSNLLGLEKYYQYSGQPTGAESSAMVNLYDGNVAWGYNAFTNPSRGLSTFVRFTYNSKDTSASAMGYGWSLQTSTLHRLGSPLDLHPRGQDYPTTVTLTDGDGTGHTFELNKHGSEDPAMWDYDHPAGVHLYLQKNPGDDASRSWVMTRPDRTRVFYDDEGYQSAIVDKNGNELLFTYAERKSNNKPTKFLQYITDPASRQTLTIVYYEKGQNYSYYDDGGDKVNDNNLTNPKIIDQIESITDISGRTITFTYSNKGLLNEFVDGAGNPEAKTFLFTYDADNTNKNTKLVSFTDPRGNTTHLAYYDAPTDPKFKWSLQTLTDRLGHPTGFSYVDPDGSAGSDIEANVLDAEDHNSFSRMDGFARPIRTVNAKNEENLLGWDADNNVTRLEEDNGAFMTWQYDHKTGFPLEIRTAQANADSSPATVLSYAFGLNGHVANLIEKTSPAGRKWQFGYDAAGNLTSVIDPLGTATSASDDYTTRYEYDPFGQLTKAIDANGHATTNNSFDPNGYPTTITDPLNNSTQFVYDLRGQVTSVTDALGKQTAQAYDMFGRPGQTTVPKDQASNVLITTPAPTYDRNDNITHSIAPNGAVSEAVFDAADQLTYTLDPKDDPADPERKTSFTYDKVGNQLAVTEPKGNLTPTVGDFTTTNRYDAIYQLIEVTNADGHKITSEYDNVGNLRTVVDPRKNTTADPNDYTTKYTYNLDHRRLTEIDAAGHTASTEYDRDGNVVATIDKENNRSTLTLDGRGGVIEQKVPHRNVGGTITYNTTKYEYDQAGNKTKTITPRGVNTPTVDDFTYQTVYDELNRPKEQWTAFDPADSRYNTPDKTFFTYDPVGQLAKVSSPPSSGETVRNDTTYTYWDNGWTRSSTDPWDIVTTYDYNALGQQTENKLSSAGGSVSRTMSWNYYPSGNLKARSDDGVPVGKHAVVVDGSDSNNATRTGPWTTSTAGTGYHGYNYHTAPAGTGATTTTWNLHIPQDGTYELFIKYPSVAGAASDTPLDVEHAGVASAATVNQTTGAGSWVSVGQYVFTAAATNQKVVMSNDANGTVVADAIRLVRNNAGESDTEKKDFSYLYDPNGNLIQVTDRSSDARIDTYGTTYDDLNRVAVVEEKLGGVVKNATSFGYNENGSVTSRLHDSGRSIAEYDTRELPTTVTNTDHELDPNPRVTTYTHTPRGQVLKQTKPNSNTVDHSYYLNGPIEQQTERRAGGAIVADHRLEYTANGDVSTDAVKLMNADNTAATVDNTYTYTYDPRDRIAQVNKTGTNPATETYVHDANSNVTQQTVKGVTTNYNYDRNRLMTASAGTTSSYNYDPIGRLDTVTSGGSVQQKYRYDGFDRIAEQTTGSGASAKTTRYVYDPYDRTASQTKNAGAADEETTTFNYFGTSGDLASEEVAGQITKSYEYTVWGQRLSQLKHNGADPDERSHYTYNPKGDVEAITKHEDGTTRATYGYSAYGSNDETRFTGIDKPDPSDPERDPHNNYRFQGHRLDEDSDTYDMGFRNYDPGLNRFLTRDLYTGALNDLTLATDPFTGSRYGFAGGNPITNIELDGHIFGVVGEIVGGVVNHVKEDPVKAATELVAAYVVGNIAVAATATACVGSGFSACPLAVAVAVGATAGAAGAGAGYGVDLLQGDHEFNLIDYHKTTAVGALFGGATAGLGYGLSSLFRRGTTVADDVATTKPNPGNAAPESGPGGSAPKPGSGGAAPEPTVSTSPAPAPAPAPKPPVASAPAAAPAPAATRLGTRVAQVHGVLDDTAQRLRTTAVMATREGRDVIAGGTRDLSPAQRGLARAGDVLGKLPGEHAEKTALAAAGKNGLTPLAIETSWNICPSCRSALEKAGATLTGPRSAWWLSR